MNKPNFHGRWFNDRLNTRYYDDIEFVPHDDHSILIRRRVARVRNSIHDITSKIDMISYHVHMVEERISLIAKLMPEMLEDLSKDIGANPDVHLQAVKNAEIIMEFYDYILSANLESALVQTKAFLDSIAQFYSVVFERDIRSFSSKGKNLLNDISNLPKTLTVYSDDLCSTIKSAKKEWIGIAIDYRDKVVHFGCLREFRCPTITFDNRIKYSIKDVKNSIMPDQRETLMYLHQLFESQFEFCKRFLDIGFRRLRERYPIS